MKKVLNRSPLPRCDGPPGPFGIDITLHIAIVRRIGVYDAADRAMVLGDFHFHTAEGIAIPHNYYLALLVRVDLFQLVIVAGQTIVRVDERGCYIATRAIPIKEWGDLWV